MPYSVELDLADDILFVGDIYKVSKFNASTGAFLGALGNVSASTGTCPASGPTGAWCTGGTFTHSSSDGAFDGPAESLTYDSATKTLYVIETTGKMSKFNASSGAFIGGMGDLIFSSGSCPSSGAAPTWCTGGTFTMGSGDGMFGAAGFLNFGLAVDPNSNALFVSDGPNNRIQLFVK